MSIGYVRIKRKITAGNDKSEKYFPIIHRNSDVKYNELVEKIVDQTSLSASDIIAVITALEENITNYLLDGRTVRMKRLGSFAPKISAKVSESLKDCNEESITKAGIRYVPSVKMKKRLKEAKYHVVDLQVKGYMPKNVKE